MNNLQVLCRYQSSPPREKYGHAWLIFLDPVFAGRYKTVYRVSLSFQSTGRYALFMSLHLMSLLRPGFDQLPKYLMIMVSGGKNFMVLTHIEFRLDSTLDKAI